MRSTRHPSEFCAVTAFSWAYIHNIAAALVLALAMGTRDRPWVRRRGACRYMRFPPRVPFREGAREIVCRGTAGVAVARRARAVRAHGHESVTAPLGARHARACSRRTLAQQASRDAAGTSPAALHSSRHVERCKAPVQKQLPYGGRSKPA